MSTSNISTSENPVSNLKQKTWRNNNLVGSIIVLIISIILIVFGILLNQNIPIRDELGNARFIGGVSFFFQLIFFIVGGIAGLASFGCCIYYIFNQEKIYD